MQSWSWDMNTAFLQSATVNGLTTTFTPEAATGNVAMVTRPNGKTTSFEYSWGQVSAIETPEPGYRITREINQDGTLKSETQAGRTTTYTYDDLMRLRTIQGPGGASLSAPVIITYDNVSGRITTSRGASWVQDTLDGFGRTRETLDSVGVQTQTIIDALGRVTYQSYPFTAGVGAGNIGTFIRYDGLNRTTRETHPDGYFRELVYAGNTVTVRDEEHTPQNPRQTVYTFQAFGHPDDARLAQQQDALGYVWTYDYTVEGAIKTLSGPDNVVRVWNYNHPNRLLASETHPESGTVTYTYQQGVLTQRVDAEGTTFGYAYDFNDRVKQVTAGGQVTQITYETGSDNVESMAVSNGAATTFRFDAAGRVDRRSDALDGHTFVSEYDYYPTDVVREITYPSQRRVRFDYDAGLRLSRVYNDSDSTYASAFTYHPSGALTGYTTGNDGNELPTVLAYDSTRYWLGSVRVGNAESPLLKLDYSYFPTGNVQTIVDAHGAGRQQTFGYDKLSRLTSVTGTGGYPSAAFVFDAHGNRQGGGLTYYPGTFRLKSIGGFGDLIYDDNGNLTHHSGGAFQYSYTPDNRLSTATAAGVTTQVAYDADAWRVKTTVSGGATTYSVRGLAGELLSEWTETSPNPTIRDYIYAGSRLLAAITSGSGSGGGGGGGVPSGWSQADVGPVAVAGSASHSGGTFTVAGAGADIWGTSDEFHYVYGQLTGDGQIVARVLSVEYVHHWTKAGVMMRESLTAGSTHAYMLVSADRGLAFQHRTATGGSSTSTDGGAGTAPVWVRLTRVGDTFTAERSANGTSWTLVGTETITMATTIYVGLAVTSHDTSATATATFDNVSVTGGGGGLPSGWSATDIGAVGVAGSASHSGATFTVAGAGADIWDTSDGFHYVSQPLTGDGQIVARVPSVEYVHHWTKAGVMMRESLTAGSTHAYMLVSADRGLAFQRRTATGGISTSTDGGAGAAPVWVRLTRVGHTFTAERSANGVSWTFVGTEAITMATTIYVGLAVTSHDTSATATATFDNVSVDTGGGGGGLPSGWSDTDVGAVGVAGSTDYASGTFTVAGSGSTIWGSSDEFHYAYRALTGDGQIVARVATIEPVDPGTKAGVMMRESLTAGSRHALMAVSVGYGLEFIRRTATGGSSTETSGGSGTAPRWVRLTRTGTTVTAERSTDGTSWTLVGTETITMGATIYVGLAVTSQDNSTAATATFDNVVVP